MPKLQIIFHVFLLLVGCIATFAQSSLPDIPPCDTDKSKPFEIPFDQEFMVKVETAINANSNRRGDIVQFLTIDDLTTKLTRDLYKQTVKFDPTKLADTLKIECERIAEKKSDHIYIPAGSRLYGRVDSRRNKSFLWLGSRSQLLVQIEYIVLKNGKKIDVSFNRPMDFNNLLPCDDKERKARQKLPGPTEIAPKNGEQCIEGRRPQIDWATAILSPLVAGYEKVVSLNSDEDEDGNDSPFALTSAAVFSKATGFGDLLNGTVASINAGQMFPVVLVKAKKPDDKPK